jgi:hypothetical protein
VDFKGDSFNGHEWKGRTCCAPMLMGQGRYTRIVDEGDGRAQEPMIAAPVCDSRGQGEGPSTRDVGARSGIGQVADFGQGHCLWPGPPPAVAHKSLPAHRLRSMVYGLWTYACVSGLWGQGRRAASGGHGLCCAQESFMLATGAHRGLWSRTCSLVGGLWWVVRRATPTI